MDASSDWRFKTHLANLPIYFEYQADGIGSTDAIKGTYLDNYKNMFDLYINNSTCAPTELAGKTGDDSRNESWTMRLSSTRTVLGNIPTSSAMASPSPMTT